MTMELQLPEGHSLTLSMAQAVSDLSPGMWLDHLAGRVESARLLQHDSDVPVPTVETIWEAVTACTWELSGHAHPEERRLFCTGGSSSPLPVHQLFHLPAWTQGAPATLWVPCSAVFAQTSVFGYRGSSAVLGHHATTQGVGFVWVLSTPYLLAPRHAPDLKPFDLTVSADYKVSCILVDRHKDSHTLHIPGGPCTQGNRLTLTVSASSSTECGWPSRDQLPELTAPCPGTLSNPALVTCLHPAQAASPLCPCPGSLSLLYLPCCPTPLLCLPGLPHCPLYVPCCPTPPCACPAAPLPPLPVLQPHSPSTCPAAPLPPLPALLPYSPLCLPCSPTPPLPALLPHSPCACPAAPLPLYLPCSPTPPLPALLPHSPSTCPAAPLPLYLPCSPTPPLPALLPHSPSTCPAAPLPLYLPCFPTPPLPALQPHSPLYLKRWLLPLPAGLFLPLGPLSVNQENEHAALVVEAPEGSGDSVTEVRVVCTAWVRWTEG
ncbi:uncharacterized protein LOC143638419 [Callospermophilus lateralis]|uniref:uncharacterized protein LOC143638419 n=1 Tax=Callospermophilus lateralis TaxID=76772 RepID=UPI004053F5CF